jgi:HD-like signal output (HDOD) protein
MTTEHSETPLESLLAEMDKGGDFPALSRTINEINHAVGDENSRAGKLTEIILRDIALTKKLLRLVNAAHYGAFGGQPISTISRAVVILGFDTVRNTAVSLMLFEHLQNHAHVDVLRGEAVDSFYRGVLGRLLAGSAGVRDGEEAFISALFRDLGRLMARFHFFEKTEQTISLMAEEMLDEQSASHKVLGASYDELGLAIARHWHFPSNILHAMAPIEAAPQKKAATSDSDRLQVVANMARELHRSVAGKTPEEQEQAIDALYLRYREVAHISRESLFESVHEAAQTLRSEAIILDVDVGKSALIKQLLRDPAAKSTNAATDEIRQNGDALPEAPNGNGNDPTSELVMGMQDLTAMMLGQYHLADIFKLLAELFFRTELFDHVLVCVLDRSTQSLIGRVGLGRNSAQMRGVFRIPLSFTPDVFHAAIAKGQDILISDATADNIRSRIPEWHVRAFHAHAFLLLPVMVHNKPLGLIYADKIDQPLQIPSQLLGLLKALRNQAALALHQKL